MAAPSETVPEPSRARLLIGRTAVAAGLAGLAVAQPVLDLFGANPEFFVSGNYSSSQVVWFGIVVVLVPVAISAVVVVASELVHPLAGRWAHRGLLALWVLVFVAGVLRRLDVERSSVVALAGLAAAAAVLLAERRWRGLRMFLAYLAAGNVLYLFLFLFASRTAELIGGGSGDAVPPAALGRDDVPVYVLILDEFPVQTIMRSDGTLNTERFPNLGRLADSSTWYRNASTRAAVTPVSVPNILTGMLPEKGQLPTADDHPRSIFSLIGNAMPVHAFEIATDICPETVCEPVPPSPLSQAFEDAAVVFGHRVLPPRFGNELPPIDNAYGGFFDELGADAPDPPSAAPTEGAGGELYTKWRQTADIHGAPAQRDVLRSLYGAFNADPEVHVIHVAIPHSRWTLTPYGDVRNAVLPKMIERDDSQAPFHARLQYQMHALQAGATDTLVGEFIDRLESLGVWDDALVVITSDHGVSLELPDFGRKETADNRENLLRVPLFVKAPGQRAGDGVVDDQPAQSIDIVPTIADLLDADVDWEFDGHSLVDGSEPRIEARVSSELAPLLAIVQDRSRQFAGDTWADLAAVGAHAGLVGRPVESFAIGRPDPRQLRIDQSFDLGDAVSAGGKVPYVLTATLSGAAEAPDEFVVAVNGTVAGVFGGPQPADDGWTVYAFVLDNYRDGVNDVVAYAVDGERLRPFR